MTFDPAWLDLREPADRAARDPTLLGAAVRHLAAAPDPLALALDLGCGTGATFRAFAGRPPGLRWRLVDHDPSLLELAASRCGSGAETVTADLADLDALPLRDVRLVTASALLDLAGEAWLRSLVRRLSSARIGLYAALTYDGRMSWDPPHPDDAAVTAAFNTDQRREKGLGPALGPAAAPTLAKMLAAKGYEVQVADSPWRLGPEGARLHEALLAGIASATGATAWAQARRAASGSGCTVGHVDVLALPQGASAQSKTTSLSSP